MPTQIELEIFEAELRKIFIEVSARVDTAALILTQANTALEKLDDLYARVGSWVQEPPQ